MARICLLLASEIAFHFARFCSSVIFELKTARISSPCFFMMASTLAFWAAVRFSWSIHRPGPPGPIRIPGLPPGGLPGPPWAAAKPIANAAHRLTVKNLRISCFPPVDLNEYTAERRLPVPS